MNPKPTIGRIVHVYAEKLSPMGDTLNGPEAAMIVGLHEEEHVGGLVGLVDLVVFQSNGIFHKNRVAYSETPAPYRWTWPPRV